MKIKILLAGLVLCSFHAAFGQTELIVNGGFEAGAAGWTFSGSGGVPFTDPSKAHAPSSGYLSLGGVNNANVQVYQTITIPSNTVNATLTFYQNVFSTDTINPTSDILNVWITTNKIFVASVFSASGQNSVVSQGLYSQQSFNLTPYAGRDIQVVFLAQTAVNSGNLTVFSIDDVSVSVETTDDIPPNDFFAARTVLTGTNIAAIGTSTFATKEPGEPNHAGNAGGKSLWWSWTAPAIGTVTINTDSSSFQTLLAAYTGSSVSNLTRMASDAAQDDPNGGNQIKFNVTSGTEYQIAVDGLGGASGNIFLNLAFRNDVTAPKISISSPASGAKLTAPEVTVTGTASDAVGVTNVQYQLENASGTNGGYQVATGTTRWTATVTNLVPGPNTVRVRAIDSSGNISVTVSRMFVYVVSSPLTLTTAGNGNVSPKLNGQLLGVGSTYTVTAKPSSGSVFAGWSGDLSSNNPKLTFVMQSNMSLHADFIPNPFPPVVGIYEGLFSDPGGIAFQSSGFFHAAVTARGTFSAKFQTGGKSYSMSGHFSATVSSSTASSSNSVVRKGLSPLTVLLQLDLTGETLTGQLSDGVWTANLLANRATFKAKSNPAPQMGKYTLVLPPGDDPATLPGGYSFGSLVVDGSGNIKFTGTLGDGTKTAQKTTLSSGGLWPFYVPLYSGHGSVFGWLTFTNDLVSDIEGPMTWIKLPQPTKFYPAGFTNETEAAGSTYVFTKGTPVLTFGSGQLSLAGGNLQSFTNPITLGSDNKVTGTGINLSVATSSGLFKGTVEDPNTTRKIPVSGAILQKQDAGFGLFSGTNQTGQVFLGP